MNAPRPRTSFFALLLAYCALFRLMPYVLGTFGWDMQPDLVKQIWTIPFLGSFQVEVAQGMTWYPWNFAPMVAATICFGASYGTWRAAGPIVLMVYATDWVISLLAGQVSWNFTFDQLSVTLTVIATYALVGRLGAALHRGPRWSTVLGSAVVAEVLFFVTTNVACFLAFDGFERSFNGLMSCFLAALPFAGRQLVGTLVFTGLLFSAAGRNAAGLEPLGTDPSLAPVPRPQPGLVPVAVPASSQTHRGSI